MQSNRQENVRSFEDLEVYRTSREFRKQMYGVARRLPEIEKYGLTGQMRRAAVSLTNNVAESHGRYHYLDNIKFVLNARGSLAELIDDLNTCVDEKYLPDSEIAQLKNEGYSVARLMNGYIRYLRDCKAGESLGVREASARYMVEDEDPFSPAALDWLDALLDSAHQQPTTNNQ